MLTPMQKRVQRYLWKYGPLTDEQLQRRLPNTPPSTVRSRRAELVDKHLVKHVAVRKNTRGRFVYAWKSTRAPTTTRGAR